MKTLHVIDGNCTWIRSLVESLPNEWNVIEYKIYNPKWLPGGFGRSIAAFQIKSINARIKEALLLVPGWNRFPKISSLLILAFLVPQLLNKKSEHFLLFTFPFYSPIALFIKKHFSGIKIFYHSHDPFEFYNYPQGYIKKHEDALIPLCNHVFAISKTLANDFSLRYPSAKISILRNATNQTFLQSISDERPEKLKNILNRNRKIIGCIGQINSSYDWDLIELAVSAIQSADFVFIGNLFEEGTITERIRRLFSQPNVHWLGPVAHDQLPTYLDAFDVCLNPLAKTPHNERRDPLRLYDYLTTDKRIASTAIASAFPHKNYIDIFPDNESLVAFLDLPRTSLEQDMRSKRRQYIETQTWKARALELHRGMVFQSSDSPDGMM